MTKTQKYILTFRIHLKLPHGVFVIKLTNWNTQSTSKFYYKYEIMLQKASKLVKRKTYPNPVPFIIWNTPSLHLRLSKSKLEWKHLLFFIQSGSLEAQPAFTRQTASSALTLLGGRVKSVETFHPVPKMPQQQAKCAAPDWLNCRYGESDFWKSAHEHRCFFFSFSLQTAALWPLPCLVHTFAVLMDECLLKSR